MVRPLGSEMPNVDTVETGPTGRMGFIVIRYSITTMDYKATGNFVSKTT
jgi:hypothetical protein